MIRQFTNDDRQFFLDTADVFYHTDAVEKPLPMKKLQAIFDEIMRSDVYAEGYILECDGERAGYSILAKTFQTESAGLTVWIEDIYILPEYRGKGLGGEFFRFIHEKYKGKVCRFRLEVEPYNEPAMHLYEKNGFRVLPYTEMVKEFDYE